MPKQQRQYAIKEIIADDIITSQDQLKRALKRKGFKVTQATLSRDIHELGVIRVATEDGNRYIIEPKSGRKNLRLITGNEIVSIRHNNSLIVVVTLPGHANSVAQYIDMQDHSDILGTIAGDDTIFIAPVSTKKITSVIDDIRKLLIEA